MKKLCKQLKNRKGFTLIELVIVVAILGILAAVITPVIIGQVSKAYTATDTANVRSVYNAAVLYLTEQEIAGTLSYNSGTITPAQLSTYLGGVDGTYSATYTYTPAENGTNATFTVTATYKSARNGAPTMTWPEAAE